MGRSEKKPAMEWKGLIRLRAREGHLLPVFYRGAIVRIDSKSVREFQVELMPYETAIVLQKAIKDEHVERVTEES